MQCLIPSPFGPCAYERSASKITVVSEVICKAGGFGFGTVDMIVSIVSVIMTAVPSRRFGTLFTRYLIYIHVFYLPLYTLMLRFSSYILLLFRQHYALQG